MSDTPLVIVTHNGTFHLDEVTAYAILNYLYPNNIIIRSRDPDVISAADYAIDVGQIYDHEKHRYDHHQDGFNEKFNSKTSTKFSSAGLIYKHFGKLFLEKYCSEKGLTYDVNQAYYDLYQRCILEIDAHDNGIRQYSDNFYDLLENKQITYNHNTNLGIGMLVSKLNNTNLSDELAQHNAFIKASNLVFQALDITFSNYLLAQMSAVKDQELIDESMKRRHEWHESQKIVVVNADCQSWSKSLKHYETANPDEPKVHFIIYQNNNKGWNIKTINDQLFKNRTDLLSEEQLKVIVKCPEDITFVHLKKFIGVSKTLETAISMGIASLLPQINSNVQNNGK